MVDVASANLPSLTTFLMIILSGDIVIFMKAGGGIYKEARVR